MNNYENITRFEIYIGGNDEAVACKGQDQFGNRYFEDFSVDNPKHRRWVEYSDYFMNFGPGTDRIPPGWYGWLSNSYSDTPLVRKKV